MYIWKLSISDKLILKSKKYYFIYFKIFNVIKIIFYASRVFVISYHQPVSFKILSSLKWSHRRLFLRNSDFQKIPESFFFSEILVIFHGNAG